MESVTAGAGRRKCMIKSQELDEELNAARYDTSPEWSPAST